MKDLILNYVSDRGGGAQINVLDLGCSGGGFVKSILDSGDIAVGLEGSDYSKIMKRAEWRTIPEYLFTCDITRRFQIYENGKPMKFDVVTAWEVMEHINSYDVPKVAENVKKHLKIGGLWIMSVSNNSDIHEGKELHQSQQSKDLWIKQFEKLGFHNHEELVSYFKTQFVRGKWETPIYFHLVLSTEKEAHAVPHDTILESIGDYWIGTRWQKILKIIVCGY